jgi:hypothetical protein
VHLTWHARAGAAAAAQGRHQQRGRQTAIAAYTRVAQATVVTIGGGGISSGVAKLLPQAQSLRYNLPRNDSPSCSSVRCPTLLHHPTASFLHTSDGKVVKNAPVICRAWRPKDASHANQVDAAPAPHNQTTQAHARCARVSMLFDLT